MVKLEIYETKSPKSTLLANNTQALMTTKQKKPRPAASYYPLTGAFKSRLRGLDQFQGSAWHSEKETGCGGLGSKI